ncbi:unnamed protein product [Blepharisma stoltei]|uniref:Uncharacterized protein n=1 Tax=Blepharisma stoltei TaxID=1481888 RepID=A0AAU9JDU2_9CILI|nr:unnamed protein product [Blepharisma stoltei]
MISTIPVQPSYSIGKQKRFGLSSAIYNAPGPAAYNIPRDLAKRSSSFTRAKKHAAMPNGNPGPASYNTPAKIGEGPRAIIISRKSMRNQEMIPGPADYSPKYLKRNISYSMRSKSSGKNDENLPGPGAYSGNPVKPNSPRATIGRARRLSLNSDTINPGPGAYESKWERIKNPNYSFSHSSRDGFLNTSVLEDGKESVRTHRRIKTSKEITPGPSDYAPNYNCNKILSPRAVAGRSVRDSWIADKSNPGPGNYTPKSDYFSPRFSFSRDQKTRVTKDVPGPGQYDIPSTIGSIKSTASLNNTFS